MPQAITLTTCSNGKICICICIHNIAGLEHCELPKKIIAQFYLVAHAKFS